MKSLNERIEQEKQRYLDYANQNKGKHLYVYGAGKQGVPIAQFYKSQNIAVDGFCVTNLEDNKEMIGGIPVYQLDRIPYSNEETAFVLGVRVQLNDELINLLSQNGYSNYCAASELVRYVGPYGYDFYTSPMMEITTQLGCAVNCKYCPQEVFVREYLRSEGAARSLSLNDFKKCLDKLPSNTYVEFAGFTEPFFNPDCLDMIKYAASKSYKINLFTTLRGLKPEQLDELLKIDFTECVIHVPDIDSNAVIPITDEYMYMLGRLVKARKSNGDNYIDYACAQGEVPEHIKNILGKDTRIYVVLNDRAGNLKDDTLYCQKNIVGRIRCELASDINHNVLLPDGRVLICSNDWGMKHVLGNLLLESYEELMSGEEAQRVRDDMNSVSGKYSLCRNCFQAICERKS